MTVLDFPGGRLVIRYEGVDLPYRTFDEIRQVKQTAIVEQKLTDFIQAQGTPPA